MIRFNCPHCSRPYELHPALARLPLLCKQCGERIIPPEAEPEPPPPPPPPLAPRVKTKSVPPVAAAGALPPKTEAVAPPPVTSLTGPSSESSGGPAGEPSGVPGEDSHTDPNAAGRIEHAPSLGARPLVDEPAKPSPLKPHRSVKRSGPKAAPPPAEPNAPANKSRATLLPFIADLVALVALLAGGMILGEMLAQQATGQVLSAAGSAPKFPPVELLLWAAPPVALALLYLVLSGRQYTLGAWVRSRTVRG